MIPEKVYRYEDWDVENKGIQILTKKWIHLKAPSDFNADYLECRLPRNFDNFDKDSYEVFTREQVIADNPNSPVEQIEDYLKQYLSVNPFESLPFHDKSHRATVLDIDRKKLDKFLGIFCFSKSMDKIEMWEKGSNLGTGFCIGLHTELLFQKTRLSEGEADHVIYYKNLPLVDAISKNEEERISNASLARFTVPDRYNYEDEFRFIRTNYSPFLTPLEYAPYERIVPLPDEVFSEIILGPNISKHDKAKIIETPNVNLKNIPIWVLDKDQYEHNSAIEIGEII